MSNGRQGDPKIRFGGKWTPAHEVWKKMETANAVAAAIERFNKGFPHLSTVETRNVVPLVRQRLKDIELRMPSDGLPDLAPIAVDLLKTLTPEAALQALTDAYGVKLELHQLVEMAGNAPYIDALAREAVEYEDNRISPEQTAYLWNDAGRPAPGGGQWNEGMIRDLLDARP